MDDLKDEVAELRRRLASEEAEAKKLREEVCSMHKFCTTFITCVCCWNNECYCQAEPQIRK